MIMGGVEPLKDPVCGMSVPPDGPHRYVHAGRTYGFCSARCLEKFRAEPERYLAPMAVVAATPPGSEYTCPMHPEVRRQRAGRVSDLRHGARAAPRDR